MKHELLVTNSFTSYIKKHILKLVLENISPSPIEFYHVCLLI